MKVIDPTCGSGAFLFAALRLLHTLYTAIAEAADVHATTSSDPAMHDLLESLSRHKSRDYYILKHAALSNLYGVDIMSEAVEIARLRLFLKLVSHIDSRDQLEPLPDLEFNIRTGNALVGAVDRASVAQRVDITKHTELDAVLSAVDDAARTYSAFTDAQRAGNDDASQHLKATLRETLDSLRTTLNGWWQPTGAAAGETWIASHKPFHWLIEFPEVFAAGGFDVVVGNPPYLSPKDLPYRYSGFATDDCPDIYAPIVERSVTITVPDGRLGMIVPLNLSWGPKFGPLRRVIRKRMPQVWSSTYALVPSGLFTGSAIIRNTIVIAGPGDAAVHTSSYNKWIAEYRPHLMPTQRYVEVPLSALDAPWPKVGHSELVEFATRSPRGLGAHPSKTEFPMGYKKSGGYWLSVFVEPPLALDARRQPRPMPKLGWLHFPTDADRYAALAIASSLPMFMWWVFHANEMDVTGEMFKSFPLSTAELSTEDHQKLADIGRQLDATLRVPGEHWLWTPYKREWRGNFDFTKLRHITCQVDEILWSYLGLEHRRNAFKVEYQRFMKIAGDRPGTVRGELPDRDR